MQFIDGQGLDARHHRAASAPGPGPVRSGIKAATAGQSRWPWGEHYRHGIDTPTLGDGVEVSLVLRSILTGRFDPGRPRAGSGGSLAVDAGRRHRRRPRGTDRDRDRRRAAGSDRALTQSRDRECDRGRRNRPRAGRSARTLTSSPSAAPSANLGDAARGYAALLGRVGSAQRSSAAWRRSAGRSPGGWPMPTRAGSSTGTSSRRTCCWTPRAWSGSPISAWPRGTTRG